MVICNKRTYSGTQASGGEATQEIEGYVSPREESSAGDDQS